MLQHSKAYKTMNKSLRNNSIKSVRNILISFGIFGLISFQINAEGLFDGPGLFDTPTTNSGDNSFYDSSGSLVIIKNAQDSGLIVKNDGNGTETEYYVVPKSDGSNTFIYDDGLTICNSTIGCY